MMFFILFSYIEIKSSSFSGNPIFFTRKVANDIDFVSYSNLSHNGLLLSGLPEIDWVVLFFLREMT